MRTGSVYSTADYIAVSGKQNSPEAFTQPPLWYVEELKRTGKE